MLEMLFVAVPVLVFMWFLRNAPTAPMATDPGPEPELDEVEPEPEPPCTTLAGHRRLTRDASDAGSSNIQVFETVGFPSKYVLAARMVEANGFLVIGRTASPSEAWAACDKMRDHERRYK